jgi:hypothetical protein
MQELNLVQISVNMRKTTSFYSKIWGKDSVGVRDERFLIKTLMTECFPGVSPRPWRVQSHQENGETVILGYTAASKERMQDLAADIPIPELSEAISPHSISLKSVRQFRQGETFKIHVNLCGTVRTYVNEQRREHDAWIRAAQLTASRNEPTPQRAVVYGELLTSLMCSALSVSKTSMQGYRMSMFARKGQDSTPISQSNEFPIADMTALASISDPEALRDLLAGGIGRSKAYGCGMLLMLPV